jgi:hypothetical protein
LFSSLFHTPSPSHIAGGSGNGVWRSWSFLFLILSLLMLCITRVLFLSYGSLCVPHIGTPVCAVGLGLGQREPPPGWGLRGIRSSRQTTILAPVGDSFRRSLGRSVGRGPFALGFFGTGLDQAVWLARHGFSEALLWALGFCILGARFLFSRSLRVWHGMGWHGNGSWDGLGAWLIPDCPWRSRLQSAV